MHEADGFYKIWIHPMDGLKYRLYGPDGKYISCAGTLRAVKRLIRKHRKADAPHEIYRERA